MTIKNSKGFTLVEMLVVIAIISVLAAALFPAITGALNSASATALKQKGRGIWVAITETNMEREPLNLTALWPYELNKADTSVSTAPTYFTYLLSDGETKTTIADDTNSRVATDLSPESLIASGIKAAKSGEAVGTDTLAWGVVVVADSTPGEIPFLISRNFQNSGGTLAQVSSDTDTGTLNLSDVKPFNTTRAVWVTRGGGTFDARAKYFTQRQVMGLGSTKAPGKDSTTFDYWETVE